MSESNDTAKALKVIICDQGYEAAMHLCKQDIFELAKDQLYDVEAYTHVLKQKENEGLDEDEAIDVIVDALINTGHWPSFENSWDARYQVTYEKKHMLYDTPAITIKSWGDRSIDRWTVIYIALPEQEGEVK